MQKTITFLMLAMLIPAQANTVLVSDGLDTTNATSLRGAVIAANAGGGANTIILTGPAYALTIPGIDEDGAYAGDLDITNGNLTIIGSAQPPAVIDATGLGDRVFQVFPNAQLTLVNVMVTGGTAPGGFYGTGYAPFDEAEPGGAIYNLGTLILDACTLSNNVSGSGDALQGNGGGTSGADGGGIYNAGLLTMANCSLMANSCGSGFEGAFGGNGGAIYNSGECILTGCFINGNSSGAGGPPEGNAIGFAGAGGNGGGIANYRTLMMFNGSLSGNSTGMGATGGAPGIGPIGEPGSRGGAGGSGAGLYNEGSTWMTDSTLSGNTCGNGGDGGNGGTGGDSGPGGSGAGIYNAGTLSLNTCTIGGNVCGRGGNGGDGYYRGGSAGAIGGGGGGIYNGGSLNLTACTLAFNSTGSGGNGGNADAAPGGSGGSGGGILNNGNNAVVRLVNTLIAANTTGHSGAGGNSGLDGFGPDGAGQLQSQGFNLVGQIDGLVGLTNSVNGDLAGNSTNPINPRLSPLQMNGGPTLAFALLPGSPAIDAGDDGLLGAPYNLAVDQRGSPRLSGAHVDIGAFEYDGTLNGVVLPSQLTDTTTGGGSLQFWFNGASGKSYSVWASTNLYTWTNLGAAIENSRGWFYFQDSDAGNWNQRFYQVRYP